MKNPLRRVFLRRYNRPMMPPRIKRIALLAAQIGLLILIWIAATSLSHHLLPMLPPTVTGIALALALLALGLLRREWLAEGAGWLLREMLLFFIPVVVAVLQYRDVLSAHFFAILFLIAASTAAVMISTALAVDLAWRLEARWRARGDRS